MVLMSLIPLTYFTGTLVSSSATITGGTINGTAIGGSSAAAGSFTTLAASGNTTLTGDLAVNGNTTLGNASGDTILLNAATATIPNNLTFSGTGTIRLPNGTTAERPSPTAGMIRYNTTEASFEGYAAGAWGSIGGGATGAGGDQVFYENELTVTASYTLTTSKKRNVYRTHNNRFRCYRDSSNRSALGHIIGEVNGTNYSRF
jgi:hypothetical protein